MFKDFSFVQNKKRKRHQTNQHRNNQRQRIGLVDVGNNFISINQIINSDKIEAHTKFVPKRKFCHSAEIHNNEQQNKVAIGTDFIEKRTDPAFGQQQKINDVEH